MNLQPRRRPPGAEPPLPIRHEDENGVVTTHFEGNIVAVHEPGWYAAADVPTSCVIVETHEATLDRRGFRLPVTIRDNYGNAHSFIADGIRAIGGGNAIRYGEQFIIKCPDRPRVGYWRKVEGIQD